ncbi:hypothetical protein [Chelativorans sp. M5D2P16]|uniref:hypothetical protein n=1 Tax=Chelativorans sp. M5D2P16 TaxID=3095678 RepID=UPI002ACA36A3|nr:hypothetical protein [Chelativorans sp. M5D2P16]MDZ5699058.1 hypothetical protein [Chelativorans sp. M5D2P16]
MNPPRQKPEHEDPPTVDRLRHDIDSGKTGEKVPYPDPAAAPLGADDEAAGAPPTARRRRQAVTEKPRGEPARRSEPGVLVLYALLIGGVLLVVLGAVLLLRA